MNYLLLALDIVVIMALFLLALMVVIKDSSSRLNRNFMFFVLAVGGWIASNTISNYTTIDYSIVTFATYAVFLFSAAATIFLLKFSIYLTGDDSALTRYHRGKYALWFAALLGATPLVVSSVSQQDNVNAVHFGALTPIYALGLFTSIISSILVLSHNMKKAKGSLRGRIRVLYISLVISLPLLIITQFVLPALTGWFGLTNIGVLSMLGIVYGLYYGVAKHKLFDLRPIIIRSLAYVVTLAILTAFYVSTTSFASSIFINDNLAISVLVNGVLILTVVISYDPLKKLFRKLTRSIFYQDIYEPQLLLTELNKVLASTIEVKTLTGKSEKLIADVMNLEFCTIYLPHAKKANSSESTGLQGLEALHALSMHYPDRVVTAEHLKTNDQHLRELFERNNIGAIAKLVTQTKLEKSNVGLLILGNKRTGYAFNSQDVNTVGAVSNELMIALQNALHFEEIQQFNLTLQEKVDEATRKYRATNEKLRKLDETKDEFISMASHQLRTPLTSVKGYLSMVLEGDAGELKPQQAELLKQSFLSSERMVNLIADLLNLSRLNTGKFVIDAHPTDLRDVVEGELAQLKEVAKAKDIELNYDRPTEFPSLMLDENKIHQVVMNFVDNAIYYTPPGGTIHVSLSETPTAVEYRVTDTGIGVPKALQHRLFTKFYRADNARRMRPDGTGLGIFMAKKVVIAQGGSIIFESEEGKGSTFGFRFSKKSLAVPNPAPEQA